MLQVYRVCPPAAISFKFLVSLSVLNLGRFLPLSDMLFVQELDAMASAPLSPTGWSAGLVLLTPPVLHLPGAGSLPATPGP